MLLANSPAEGVSEWVFS